MPRSLQEELIHKISHSILGKQALFFPELFGKNGEEPADLVWVVNRCAILMYMTESKKRYESKREHNLSQLGRWLKYWKSGQPLCGTSGATKHRILFDDIDHIIGLSIVDGGETWCEYHGEHVSSFADHKLSACATITGAIMRDLADNVAGPRDLVAFLKAMRGAPGERHAENELLTAFRTRMTTEITATALAFGPITKPSKHRQYTISETIKMFASIKSQITGSDTIAEITGDLRISDIAWFSSATSALESQIAAPATTGPIVAHIHRKIDIYQLECLTTAHTGIMKDKLGLVQKDKIPGIALLTAYDLGKGAPIRMCVVVPRTGPSMLTRELDELRLSDAKG